MRTPDPACPNIGLHGLQSFSRRFLVCCIMYMCP